MSTINSSPSAHQRSKKCGKTSFIIFRQKSCQYEHSRSKKMVKELKVPCDHVVAPSSIKPAKTLQASMTGGRCRWPHVYLISALLFEWPVSDNRNRLQVFRPGKVGAVKLLAAQYWTAAGPALTIFTPLGFFAIPLHLETPTLSFTAPNRTSGCSTAGVVARWQHV